MTCVCAHGCACENVQSRPRQAKLLTADSHGCSRRYSSSSRCKRLPPAPLIIPQQLRSPLAVANRTSLGSVPWRFFTRRSARDPRPLGRVAPAPRPANTCFPPAPPSKLTALMCCFLRQPHTMLAQDRAREETGRLERRLREEEKKTCKTTAGLRKVEQRAKFLETGVVAARQRAEAAARKVLAS